MIDIQKLKALAQAAKEDWCNWYTLQQLENRAVDGAGAEMIVAAKPAVVLELIDRIERLSADNKAKNGSLAAYGKQISALQKAVKNRDRVLEKVSAERDKLKAENEALRKDAARLDWMQKPYDGVSGCENMARNQIDAAMSKEAGHE